jgi:hypothetical protein
MSYTTHNLCKRVCQNKAIIKSIQEYMRHNNPLVAMVLIRQLITDIKYDMQREAGIAYPKKELFSKDVSSITEYIYSNWKIK